MHTRTELRIRAGALVLAVAAATALPATEAVAGKARYCVKNSSDTHGLYTNDVYYSAQCKDPNDRKCLSREHFFSFGDIKGTNLPNDPNCHTTIVVDYDNGTVELHGWVGGNKNDMKVDVDLAFTGLHECKAGVDPVLWPKKFQGFPSNDPLVSGLADSFDNSLYCATYILDAVPDGIPVKSAEDPDGDLEGGFGDFDENMDQPVAQTTGTLQFGLGGNGLRKDLVGAYAKFKVEVPGSGGVISPKTWELGMTLVPTTPPVEPPPPPPKTFDVVLCPSDGVDTGDGNPDVAGRKDCTICWYGERVVDPVTGATSCADETFVTEFKNEPGMRGSIALDGAYDIPDPRVHCNPGLTLPGGNPVGPRTVASGVQILLDPAGQSPKPGLTISGTALTGDVYVPWYACGIPRAGGGLAFIRLINADADFNPAIDPSYRDVINSVVIHDADGSGPYGSQNPAFAYCDGSVPTNTDPVVAWLPRSDEIPMPNANSRVIRDITSGCGSTRSGSSTRSYLLSNLSYDKAAGKDDFRTIIGEEIDTIEATLLAAAGAVKSDGVTADSCIVARQNILSILFPDMYEQQGQSRFIDHVRINFNDGDYANVIFKLEWLLGKLGAIDGTNDTLDPTADLYSSFDTCYYRETDKKIVNLPNIPALDAACDLNLDGTKAEPCYPLPDYEYVGYIPRNFRGDLQAQVEHVIWNIQQNLLGKFPP